MVSNFPFVVTSHAASDEPIRIGVVGCGGRGRGAVSDAMEASPNVQLVAVADVFEEAAQATAQKYNVAPEFCFVGNCGL